MENRVAALIWICLFAITYVEGLSYGEDDGTTYSFVTHPFILHSYSRVGTGVTTIPYEKNNAKTYFKRTGDERFSPGEIIVWERFGSKVDHVTDQLNLYTSNFYNVLLTVNAYVKFIDTIPEGIEYEVGTGLFVLTSWIDRCQVNVWCRMSVTVHTKDCSSYCGMRFGLHKITQSPQVIHFANYTVTRRAGNIFPMLMGPNKFNSIAKILTYENPTLPVSYNDATVKFAEDDGDDRFLPGEVLEFEKAGVAKSGQWMALYDSSFDSQIVAVRFKIKFFNSIPTGAFYTSVRSSSVAEYSWLAQCSVGIWCDVHLRINDLPSQADYVMLIFDGSEDPIKAHVAHFTITTISKVSVCTSVQRGKVESNAASFSSLYRYNFFDCGNACQSQGYNQMTWWHDPTSSTGDCRCTNGAHPADNWNSLFCELSSRGYSKLDGQWGLWGSWTECEYVENRGCAKRRKRECGKFPPNYNGGIDNCPGGHTSFSVCYKCYLQAISDTAPRAPQLPTHVTTYTTKLEYHMRKTRTHYTKFWTGSSRSDGRVDNKFLHVEWPSTNTNLRAPNGLGNEGTVYQDLSQLPYSMLSPKNSFYIFYEQSKADGTLTYATQYKINDNPSAIKPHISNIIWLIPSEGLGFKESFYVEQLITERVQPDSSEVANFDVAALQESSDLILPSARPTLTLRLSPTNAMLSATRLSITFHLPLSIDLEEEPIVARTLGSGIFSKEERTLIWNMPYLDSLIDSFDINVTVRIANDENMLRMNDFDIKIPISIAYCEKRVCDSSNPQKLKVTNAVFSNVRGSVNAKVNLKGPKRIRSIANSGYLHVDSTGKLVSGINNFKTNLHSNNEWSEEDLTKTISTSWKSSTENEFFAYVSSSNYTNITYGLMGGAIFAYNQTSMKAACLENPSSSVVASSSWPVSELNQCPTETFKLLEGLDKSNNLVYRGILKVTSGAVGDVIVVVNPSQNLGSSSNCFLTDDLGGRWKSIDSIVTNIDFYIQSTDYMYGRCNYGNTHCKFSVSDMMTSDNALVLSTTQTDYNTARASVHAQMTLVVDDLVFSDTNPMASSIDPTIGVSVHGVYKQNGASWDRIFGWAE